MKNAIKIIVITFVIVFASINSDAKDYEGIVPLKSTRTDVERKFGLPEKGKAINGVALYRLYDRRITFYYLKASCARSENCECFVPVNTVIKIIVVFEENESFSELRLDKTKFERNVSPRDSNRVTYYDEVEGIIYAVDEAGDDIESVEYLPSKKNCDEVLSKINHY